VSGSGGLTVVLREGINSGANGLRGGIAVFLP
jgi:hypothetical protein